MIAHHFSAGTYIREAIVPAGAEVITHAHTYDHFAILGSGSVILNLDGEWTVHHAPCVIEIKAGKAHGIVALCDVTWFCVHATDVADPEKMDEVLIREPACPSPPLQE